MHCSRRTRGTVLIITTCLAACGSELSQSPGLPPVNTGGGNPNGTMQNPNNPGQNPNEPGNPNSQNPNSQNPNAPPPDPNTVPSMVVTAKPNVNGNGFVEFDAAANTTVVDFQTTMVVPAEPKASGTLFLWPGLQPGGANFDPIDNGVLQPVLTWGPSCAPGTRPADYSTWWVSGQYVNTFGHDQGYTGCLGGNVLAVQVGDSLVMHFQLHETTHWLQTVTDTRTGKSVTYDINMLGQAQNRVEFDIEGYSAAPLGDVIFTNTTFAFAAPDANGCAVTGRGSRDAVGVMKKSPDNMHCSVDKIILRAQGVTATDPTPPGP